MSFAELSLESGQLWALSLTARVCVVLLLAMFVSYLLRRRPSAERHLVWVVAVVAVLVLPFVSVLLPSVRVSISAPSWLRDVVPQPTPALAPIRVAPIAPVALPAMRPSVAEIAPAPAPVVAPRAALPLRRSELVAPAPTPAPRPLRSSLINVLMLVWVGGAVTALAAMLVGFARVHWYARHARLLTDPALQIRARGIAAELGVVRHVRLLEGDADTMPMTFGVWRPTVLLPSVARDWTAVRQQTVLRHELAHIRRHDALSQLVAELACALYWFNPLVWFAAHRLYVEREHACDDLVLVSGSRAADYAAELVEIARAMRVRRAAPLAALAMARPSQLRRRVMAVLEDRQRRAALSARLLVPAWMGAFVIVLPVSSLAPRLRWPIPREHVTLAPGPAAQTSVNTAAVQQAYATPTPSAHANAAISSVLPPVALLAEAQLSTHAAPLNITAGALTSGPGSQQPRVTQLAALLRPLQSPQEQCLSRSGNRSINSNNDDNRSTIKWSASGCSGEVIIDGDVEFDQDYTRIIGLSRGGMIRVTTEEGRTERRVTIRSENGQLTHDYSVDGQRTTFDAAGQRWLDATMLFLFRHIGFMANERATAILNRGGANAVLTEIGLLNSDHVRSQYMAVLVEKGRLDEASLRRVLELAGNTLSSDHYRTQVITAVAGRYEFTDAVRQAYIDAASRMSSDHYKHTAFSRVLAKGNLTPQQLSAVLGAAGTISSDHYRAELLRSTAGRYGMTPDIRRAYLSAATSLQSDHYKTIVLDGVLRNDLTAAETARVVEAAMSVSSDHYRAQLLGKVAAMDLRDPALQTAFVRAASQVKSPHYKQQILSTAAARPDLSAAALNSLLDAAATVGNDHYLAELLLSIAKRHRLEGETRERFMRALDSIKSTHYHGQVSSALLRQGR